VSEPLDRHHETAQVGRGVEAQRGVYTVSDAVKRLRAAIVDVLAADVRDAIRNGATIEQIVERFAVPKRFVEDQRLILKETETIPDARVVTGSGAAIRRMHKEGYTAREIAKELGVSTAYVYQQRRKLK